MNSLKRGESVPLLNFDGDPRVPLSNFKKGPGVPLLNFEWGPGSRIPGPRVPGPGVLVPLLLHATSIQVFNREICKNFKETFFYRTAPVAASES